MSEVSREEHIKRLKAYKECRKKQVKGIWEECNSYLCDNCKLCYEQGNAGEHISTIKKAISDMEKLQKIEDVMNFKCRDCSIPCDYYFKDVCKIDKIDRILKGE